MVNRQWMARPNYPPARNMHPPRRDNMMRSTESHLNTDSPIIIAGMHRSGTSLLARIVSEMGVHMGDQLDSHHESVLFKHINKQLLLDAGASWNRPEPFLDRLKEEGFIEYQVQRVLTWFSEGLSRYGRVEGNRCWGWKDPRNTLTLPVWLAAFPQAKLVFIERHGIDVALSLQRREVRRIPFTLLGRASERLMFPPSLMTGYELWYTYCRVARELQRNFSNWTSLRYEDLISEPERPITILQEFLGLDNTSADIRLLASHIVRRPTSPSRFEMLRVRLLFKLRLLDPLRLHEAGYGISRQS
jgi:hypothetical protein